MHEGEFSVTPALARQLVAQQMPDLAHLTLRRAPGVGTDNLLFRLGDFALRFPRHAEAEGQIEVMERLSALDLSLPLPRLRRLGRPSAGFPRRWAVTDWLPGRVVPALGPAAARQLADWVAELRRLPPDGPARVFVIDPARMAAQAPAVTEAAPADLARLIARAAEALPVAARVLQHGDLHALNLLTRRGRMSGVLDWGTAGVGDGTADLLPVFMAMETGAGLAYLDRLGASGSEVERAFALALQKCLAGLPYYRQSNPGFHAVLRATLSRLLVFPSFR